ncbi:hypothetical protein Taro_037780, partial [Colocasia esculenta]|nr:hypothetical protein [Colocasia esculenta]
MERMTPEKEQVTPLAAAMGPSYRTSSSEEEDPKKWLAASPGFCKRHRCCLWVTAGVVITAAATLVAVMVALYKPREPVMTMNAIAIKRMTVVPPNVSFTIVADVSVKNQNPTPFYFDKTLTSLYYRDALMGQAYGPPGRAAGRRTYRSNVTLEVVSDKLLSNSALLDEVATGALEMNSSTAVAGHVMVLGLFRHHVDVLWKCTVLSAIANETAVVKDAHPALPLRLVCIDALMLRHLLLRELPLRRQVGFNGRELWLAGVGERRNGRVEPLLTSLGSHVDGSIDCRRLQVNGNPPGRQLQLASTYLDVCMGLAAASFDANRVYRLSQPPRSVVEPHVPCLPGKGWEVMANIGYVYGRGLGTDEKGETQSVQAIRRLLPKAGLGFHPDPVHPDPFIPPVNSGLDSSLESGLEASLESGLSLGESSSSQPCVRKEKGRQVPARFVVALAERCVKLSQVPEFLEDPALVETDFEEGDSEDDGLGVYLLDFNEEGESGDPGLGEEDPVSSYVDGTKRFDEPTMAADEPTKE